MQGRANSATITGRNSQGANHILIVGGANTGDSVGTAAGEGFGIGHLSVS